jgi:hypothetical protein
MKKLLGGLVVGLLALGTTAYGLSADINCAYVSRYIWRGQDLNAGQPAMQPALTVYLGDQGLSANVWGSYNLGTVGKQEITEVDYTLTLARQLNENYSWSVYYALYNYPPVTGSGSKDGEFFLTLTGDGVPFKPTLLYAYNNVNGNGSYVNLAGKQSFFWLNLPLDGSLSLGYDGGQAGAKPGFSDANLTFSSVFKAEKATITPQLCYTIVGKETRPTASNVLYFCVNVAGSL